jgi:hypothetical protein
MAYLVTHFFKDGTAEQYDKVVGVAHPPEGLPAGQTYHAAGPTDGGWLVVSVWTDKETLDAFVAETLMPAFQNVENGFPGPPEERTAEVANLVTA